ncbi:MAG: prepilin-type N-terminal cleavage/methylation domain-containing protein [Desulfobulbus sp.]|nr:prepilin-type N-terminal cleavage/methylation domain-containing protein [Desulfobulbus sp.]
MGQIREKSESNRLSIMEREKYGNWTVAVETFCDNKKLPQNQRGSTLIEAMIAIAILTVGILTVMVMQTQAIRASSSSMNRTEANTVTLALMETLKDLNFDDNILNKTLATRAELTTITTAQQLQNLIDAGKLNTFKESDFAQMKEIIIKPATATNGTVVDKSGIQYTLAWAVLDNVTENSKSIGKTIWLFMYWDSLMGPNKILTTTLKYKNTPL